MALLALLPGSALAQDAKAKSPAPPAATTAAPPPLAMPDAERIVLLLRTTLLTLNDAVQTGNFTVLRDVAAPSFREANTAGRLYQIFSDLAARRVDLSAVAILVPKLPQPPAIDQNRRLHISGHFPGQPVRIDFELLFEAVGGRWRLFGISVKAVGSDPAPQAAAPPAAEKASSPAVKARQPK